MALSLNFLLTYLSRMGHPMTECLRLNLSGSTFLGDESLAEEVGGMSGAGSGCAMRQPRDLASPYLAATIAAQANATSSRTTRAVKPWMTPVASEMGEEAMVGAVSLEVRVNVEVAVPLRDVPAPIRE